MSKTRQKRLVGPVNAIRTFRTEDGKLNLEKQRRHLRWMIDQGITEGNGVVMGAAGGGEGYFMDDGEWRAIVELTAEECKGRVPSVAGIFELSAREVARKTALAAEMGIDFVQVQPPHYMVPTDDEVFHHYKAVNDAAGIGIMCYNAPWAMPKPGYELTPPIIERLLQLENVEGVKWSSHDMRNYVTCLRLFADELNFINNQPPFVLSIPIKLGMTGFINSHANVAPRLVLHMWDLWKNKKYDEYDELLLKMYIDPHLRIHMPEELQWRGMGEGPLARAGMEAAGLSMGPSFPAQQPLSDDFVKHFHEGFEKSGLADWVDWKE
ncbi:MAG: dihydrodipicolinate synthase family protein [Planctomycetota bacterium]|jgi:4-hydroxy-tetrahydrodipicolinate synthase|nr:dihydrodipicolinate synthase family protein [Planctomycetota bacterium]